uniref:ATP synthase membrane subunit 8 n=1 Tax=Trichuris sp. LO613 TaxID=2856030 RepID=A0A8F5DPV0_9BILA|nr:ATP synthase membrane subunit 8 [Trichuris sp. LO613]
MLLLYQIQPYSIVFLSCFYTMIIFILMYMMDFNNIKYTVLLRKGLKSKSL